MPVKEKTVGVDMAEATSAPQVPIINAIVTGIALVPLVAAYLFLTSMAGIPLFAFAGFLFLLYWTGIKQCATAEFLPSLLGSLGGTVLGYLVGALPLMMGNVGLVIVALLVGGSLYLLVRNQAYIFVNHAFMLFLTIGTSFAFKAQVDYIAAVVAILIAAAYASGLLMLMKAISTRLNKSTTAQPHSA